MRLGLPVIVLVAVTACGAAPADEAQTATPASSPASASPSPKPEPTRTKPSAPPSPVGFGTILPGEKPPPGTLYQTRTPGLADDKYAADVHFEEGLWRGRVRLPADAADGYVRCGTWKQGAETNWVYQVRTTKKADYGFEEGLQRGGLMLQVLRTVDDFEDRVDVTVGLRAEVSVAGLGDNYVESESVENDGNKARAQFSSDGLRASVDANVATGNISSLNSEGLGDSRFVAKIRCLKWSDDVRLF